jgi:hypothetical protein
MNKMKLFYKTVLVLAILIPFSVLAKRPVPPTGTSNSLSGLVMDKLTQEHLEGVYLYFDELDKGIYSGKDGKFNLEGIESGDYTVTVKYISYHEKQLQVKVKKSKHNQKTIELNPVQP